MSDHIKKIAGSKSEILLYKLTDKPLKGLFIGTGITALIQSSSAVCGMVVSLVESNILSLNRAISIILGSILGTSITGWIIAYSSLDFGNTFAKIFSASVLSAVFAIVGTVFKVFMKNTKIKRLGEIFLGFAILMLGIYTITQAVEPLKENAFILNKLTSFQNPIILILLGTALAALLQSASAAVGIIQTLSLTGMITFNASIAFIIGIGIGASLPVILSAAGKSVNAKRTALSYLLIDLFGAVFYGTAYFLIISVFKINTDAWNTSSLSIALLNTIYRFLLVITLVFFTNRIEKLCRKLIKDKNIKTISTEIEVFGNE